MSGELAFVGLGLCDEKDLSLRGLEAIEEADTVFAELYTSLMPAFSISKLERLGGKNIIIASMFFPPSLSSFEMENAGIRLV